MERALLLSEFAGADCEVAFGSQMQCVASPRVGCKAGCECKELPWGRVGDPSLDA